MKRAVVNSCGMIPLYRSPDGIKVLLVEQYSAEGTHWGFPKGKPLPVERPIETAKREAKEETGITITEVIEGVQLLVQYSFTYKDTIVDKTVTYFIGYVIAPGFALQESEVKNAGWYRIDEARAKLTYMNTKAMFDQAVEFIEEHEDEQFH